jgi:BASS family bile acid:Na+ symporter
MTTFELDQLHVAFSEETRIVMAFVLATMMFNVALSLQFDDFRLVAERPVRILGGAATQLLALPALTFGFITVLEPPASIALGMIVIASCPGGNVSNVLTYFARGNAAYSVALTAISSVSATIMTPLSILVWANLYGPTALLIDSLDVDPWPFLTQTVSLLAVPLAAGMIFAARAPQLAARIRKILSPISLLALAAIVVAGMTANWDLFLLAGMMVVPLAVLHNAGAFCLGWGAAHLLRMDAAGRRSLTIEVGIQNGGLGLLILLNQFDGLGGAAAIVATWSVWHLIAGGAVAGLFRGIDWRQSRRTQDAGRE